MPAVAPLPQLPAAFAGGPPLDLAALPNGPIDGLYVHVPFCAHKCHYCDFYSITRQSAERMERFVELVLAEADLWRAARPARVRPMTIFFGGGTPTLLPPDAMRRLLAGLHERFDLSAVREWTVEANPATVTPAYCQLLRDAGVDRLSFGAQSFDAADLNLLERQHVPGDVRRSLALARDAGFARLSIDLIFAVPGQTMPSWSGTLEQAIALGTEHLSCYALTYEPNTALAVRRRLGRVTAAPESLELAMLMHTRHRLAGAGLPPYEISNFAAPGAVCQHNVMYWSGGNYVGLGPSAASHVAGWRWKNRPHLREWELAVAGGTLPAMEVETLDARARAAELAFLMLRLADGIDRAAFHAKTGYDAAAFFAPTVDALWRQRLIDVSPRSIRLTEAGVPLADGVAGEFLAL